MLVYELYDQVEAQERKYVRRSALLTLLFLLVSSVGVLIYDMVRDNMPPPGVEEYEVLGAIDFGNYNPGSRQVNNFQPPVENPVEQPQPEPTEPQPEPQPQTAEPQPAQPAETAPTPTPQVTTTEPQEVSTPDPPVTQPDPTPAPPTTTQPEPTPTQPTTNSNQSNTSTTQPTNTTPTSSPSTATSGSNHGNEDSGTGNAGTPDVKTLDPNGLYSFGSGSGGLQGRGVINLGDPAYTAQQEGVLEFKFRIEPNGTVSYATTTGPTTKLALKSAGISAIKKWKFSAVNSSQPQWVTVKITFKLKG